MNLIYVVHEYYTYINCMPKFFVHFHRTGIFGHTIHSKLKEFVFPLLYALCISNINLIFLSIYPRSYLEIRLGWGAKMSSFTSFFLFYLFIIIYFFLGGGQHPSENALTLIGFSHYFLS